jgi:hypothetical protein
MWFGLTMKHYHSSVSGYASAGARLTMTTALEVVSTIQHLPAITFKQLIFKQSALVNI